MSSLSKPDSAFERDPRRRQELAMRPIADALYRRVFGEDVEIHRFERQDEYLLDKQFGIDVTLTLFPSELKLSGQEKFLSYIQRGFQSITVEYMQNPAIGERGDWFKWCTDFYFVGYCTLDNKGFDPWVIANSTLLKLATHGNTLTWFDQDNKDGRARASFRWCRMRDIPKASIIAASWQPELEYRRIIPLAPAPAPAPIRPVFGVADPKDFQKGKGR